MSLSSNTAQTRELSELRNHLKWLDEERRKSGRKMAELEQRLAQQGRELAERDQKIQELEWNITNFSERFERIPDLGAGAAGVEQRLQDLEWHLSNMNSQLTRIPSPEDERTRQLEERAFVQEEISRAINEAQERVEAGQSILEGQLRSEMVAARDSDDRQVLIARQEELAETISRVDGQYAALQENVATLSAQLREKTVSLAAESQAGISSLATLFQEHLDAMSSEQRASMELFTLEQQARMDELAAASQTRLDELTDHDSEERFSLSARQEELAGAIGQIDEQFSALQESVGILSAQLRERTMSLSTESQTAISSLAARFQEHLDALTAEQRTAMEQFTIEQAARTDEWTIANQARFDELAANQAHLDESIDLSSLQYRQEELAAAIERLTPIETQLSAYREESNERQTLIETQLSVYREESNERLTPIETQLSAYREESNARVAQMAQQLAQLEESVAKIGNVREIMPLLDRLEQELEFRQAEEVRLSNLISMQEGRFVPLATRLDDVEETNTSLLSRLSDSERVLEELRAGMQDINDNWKPVLSEANRRIGPIAERMTALNNTILKAEAGLQSLTGDQAELREMLVNLTDDSNRNRADVSRQLEGWQATLDENKDTIERFTQQWITLSNQYKEARMAVQNFAHWQKQLEQQKREASEMLRLESNRMQSRWDGFMMEIQEKLKNFELDLGQKWQAFEFENDQKWAGSRRSEQLWREELAGIDELIQKLQQDNRNLIWRVQAAQADAIKKWPRMLLEEVEKAVELNPNRRLSSPATSQTEMSVVDAIEQGLITIDYNDESALDL